MAGRQGTQKIGSMVLSMAVVALAAVAIYVFIPHDGSGDPTQRVDYRIELLTARRAAPYPVAAPEGLPGAWKPTSVRFDGQQFDSWHLGFEDPDGQYAAVEQSTQAPGAFIDRTSQGAKETSATERIGGRVWQRYEGGHYDALVHRDKGSTTVVTGTSSFDRLAALAGALRAS